MVADITTLKWTTVTSNEVQEQKYRLEASVFKVEAKKAKDDLARCKFPLVPMVGDNGLASAYRPGICTRIFVEKGNGVPMYTPSEITHLNPKAEKFLSKKTKADLSTWVLKEDEIALTCSGTIGNVSFVSKTLAGKCFSQNMIRLVSKSFPGYLYAFIKSYVGQTIIGTNNYGAVIQHIDPEHLEEIYVPNPPDDIKSSIHEKIYNSFTLRDKSNSLLGEAETALVKALKLPPVEELNLQHLKGKSDTQVFSVPLNALNDRFDGSYHVPLVGSIVDYLLDNSEKILVLGNPEISTDIIHPDRFKRVYVNDGDGVTFFGGKGLLSIDPTGKKTISATKHAGHIKGLVLKQNMILVTRSGTIGKVNIVPEHWSGWIATDDLIRVVVTNPEKLSGYVYVWLQSDYGKTLLEHLMYGSVVDHIEIEHIAQVPIPVLEDKALMQRINDLALEANKLRTEAYHLEQAAIEQVNTEVIYA